jgi:hypothetical protein
MDPDQPAHLRSLIRVHAVPLQTLLQVEKLKETAWILIRLRGKADCAETRYVGFVMTRLIYVLRY